MKNKPKFSTSKIITIVLISIILSTIILFRTPLTNLWNLLKDQQALSAFVQQSGSMGPLILFGLLVAQVFLAIIPGHALMMAGGYVYGPLVAITITASSTILGSMVAFWVARRYGRKLVKRLARKDMHVIEKWDRIAEKQGALFFFFTFVLPIFPSDLMCYVAGLGKVEPRKFLVANIAGRLICATTITMIGVFGFEQPWQFWAIVLGGMAILFIAWGIYKKKGSKSIVESSSDRSLVMNTLEKIQPIFSNLKNSNKSQKGSTISENQQQETHLVDSEQALITLPNKSGVLISISLTIKKLIAGWIPAHWFHGRAIYQGSKPFRSV